LIREQRELLKRTFTVGQLQPAPASRTERLATTQQEILTATEEFTAALRLRVGPVAPLEQAIVHMQAAVTEVRAGRLEDGQGREESALASLIEARQNLRHILNMSNSSQAAECRQVDRQQRQKLRPPQQKQKPEFGQRLGQASSEARQLADRQQSLASVAQEASEDEQAEEATVGAQTAEEQRRLVERGEELDELMRQLAAEALDQPAEMRRMIQDASEANPTGEIVELMRAAAADFEADRNRQAAESAQLASQSLRRLAEDLREIRQRYTQPDIERLLAAEQQAADLLQKVASGQNAGARALAGSQLDELQRALDPLSAGDRRLARALDDLRDGTHRPGANVERVADVESSAEARLGHSDRVLADGLRQVTEVLQTMIQEAILDRALMDPDEGVPPGYEKMVDEYYRALSEDLR
jgi:hypothetical protein